MPRHDDRSVLYTQLAALGEDRPGLHRWLARLPEQMAAGLDEQRYGDLAGWWRVLDKLPQISADRVLLDQAAVTVQSDDVSPGQVKQIEGLLKQLMPWRKGPFNLHGVVIDTEWRSDLKWDRVVPHLDDLTDRLILDVGCGSGYHAWRMAGAGARLVLGIDPSPRFHVQFQAVRHFMPSTARRSVFHLPVGIEQVPEQVSAFDTVFSMGVLYHRRSPLEHLTQLWETLIPGGQLVLETLVVEGDVQTVLVPGERYAAMGNVWFLPSTAALEHWLARCGFTDIKTVDVASTTLEEQRATDWMTFQSLADFLDPENPSLTREGYPAPVRAVTIARRPKTA